jgi:aminoglycoside phosphotransferase family enzyme/predicted kinase
MSLKDDLLRREAYEPVTSTPVSLYETHISYVFVRDEDVFKVKKPVNLGFLDFTSIDQRRAACDAEVALNARLAPDVYRGVVPVREDSAGRCRIGGDGRAVDWAVHMRRLPDEQRGDVLLARGALAEETVDRLAKRLAEFHQRMEPTPGVARFGAPALIRRNVEENFEQTEGKVTRYLRAVEAAELARWQTEFVAVHTALFERRVQTGRVRDGHGDLRLEHVYIDPAGSITVIDCIEFSDQLRYGDVCADIAFLSMDLAAHGRVDLAERFLAAYAREADDFELYALVDFYESYRAYVRAKIASMVADEPGLEEDRRAAAVRDARRYFVLALSADRRPILRPTLVAVGGVIAAGKSTIADRMGTELGAPVIDADRTRKSMAGVGATQPLRDGAWAGSYDPAFTELVYAEVLRRASIVLRSGRPVVLDASFRSPAMRLAARRLAREHGVPFLFVECRADRAACLARLETREKVGGVSDGRTEVFDAFCKEYQPVDELPASEHLVLDTCLPVEVSIGTLREHVRTWPRGLVA